MQKHIKSLVNIWTGEYHVYVLDATRKQKRNRAKAIKKVKEMHELILNALEAN